MGPLVLARRVPKANSASRAGTPETNSANRAAVPEANLASQLAYLPMARSSGAAYLNIVALLLEGSVPITIHLFRLVELALVLTDRAKDRMELRVNKSLLRMTPTEYATLTMRLG